MSLVRLAALAATALLGACANNPSGQTHAIYTAPAQAYNLNLGNPAIVGQPYLRTSCSTGGSTLEVIDAARNYYRIDYIDLTQAPFTLSDTTSEDNALALAEYYRALYESPFMNPPLLVMPNTTDKTLFFPLPLDRPGPVARDGRVMGFAVNRIGNDLYVAQHLQSVYNQEQMATKLRTLLKAMQYPGVFSTGNIAENQTKGLIRFNPEAESDDALEAWAKEAKCS